MIKKLADLELFESYKLYFVKSGKKYKNCTLIVLDKFQAEFLDMPDEKLLIVHQKDVSEGIVLIDV